MKVIVAIGDEVREFVFDDPHAQMVPNEPMHGWIRIVTNGESAWFNLAYVIGVFPFAIKIQPQA